MFRKKFIALAVGALTLGLSACGSSSSQSTSSGASAGNSTLTLGSVTAPTTLSAQDASWGDQAAFTVGVYDTLLRLAPDGTLAANLATEWKYNADKTVLTLTLRDDVSFTDGTKFDASVAVQNLIRFRDGASPDKSILGPLKDAKALDATHVELTLTDSDPSFLTRLSRNAGYQESPATFGNKDINTIAVGSGPYLYDAANTVIGSSYAYAKNPKYWDPSKQHYDKIVVKVLSDPTAMLNAIKGHQLNAGRLLTNDALDQVKAAGYTINSAEGEWIGVFLLDRAGTMNPALKDVRVRQAINYAFDKDALLQAIGKGYGTPTTQIFSPANPAFDATLDARYPYNPAKAKDLLAEAGYPNGFTLEMPSTSFWPSATFTLLAQQLKDIGITVSNVDTGQNFISDLLTPKYPASLMQLQQDPSWELIQFSIAPTSIFNPFKYTNPDVAALIDGVHDAANQADIDAAAKKLNTYIVENAWFAPWYRPQSNYATDANTVMTLIPGIPISSTPIYNYTPKG